MNELDVFSSPLSLLLHCKEQKFTKWEMRKKSYSQIQERLEDYLQRLLHAILWQQSEIWDKINDFLVKTNRVKLAARKVENVNRPITTEEIEKMTQSLLSKKATETIWLPCSGYLTLKEEVITKLFIIPDEILFNHSIKQQTLISKPEKYIQ